MTRFREPFPILAVDDVDRAVDFYCSTFGFEKTYAFAQGGETAYAFLRLDPLGIGLSRRTAPEEPAVALWIYTDDVDDAAARLRASRATEVLPPTDQPWGERMCSFRDADGHLVHVASEAASRSVDSVASMDEEYRVEVELDDDEYGYSLWERLRALHLDDEARERLGESVMVTRDGPRLFLYAASDAGAREAERVVRELVDGEGLSADIRVTRWHEVEEAWKDASVPLPASEQEVAAEYAAREAAEAAEAQAEGEYDWNVLVHVPDAQGARDLARRLRAEGQPVARFWRYVTIGAVTEERAAELAERLRAELPEDEDVRIDVDLSDLPRSPLQFLPF